MRRAGGCYEGGKGDVMREVRESGACEGGCYEKDVTKAKELGRVEDLVPSLIPLFSLL